MIAPDVLEITMPSEIYVESTSQVAIRPPPHRRMKVRGWKRVPEIAYPIPKLIVEQLPITEQEHVSGLIEGEGSLKSFLHRTGRINIHYRRYFQRPHFQLGMKDAPSVERVAKALGLRVYRYPKAKPRTFWIHTCGTPAISIAQWAIPYTTQNSRIQKDAKTYSKNSQKLPQ